MFICLPVGTGRVVSVSKLVNVQQYMLYKYYFIVYDSHLTYNCQLYCVYIVLLQQVRSKSKKVTIFDNFDHFNGIKKCLDSVYNLEI